MQVAHIYTEQLLDDHAGVPWKLQMAAVSSRQSLMFVAQGCCIFVYRIAHHSRLPVFTSRLPYPGPPMLQDEINAITLGVLNGEETIVAAYDSGLTAAWHASGSFPVLWTKVNAASTWGCAISEAAGLVASSANSHDAYVLSAPPRSDGDITDNSSENGLQFPGEYHTLHGHSNNIPCVTFSASGKYLASASIDGTCCIWSLESRKPVFVFECEHYCWAVRFVYPFYFLPVRDTASPCHTSEELPDEQSQTSDSSASHAESSGLSIESWPHATTPPLLLEYSVDHSGDMQNGYTGTAATPDLRGADSHIDDTNPDELNPDELNPDELTKEAFEPEGALPALESPLLLCSTDRDVLLLDLANPRSPVLDRIEQVTARTALSALAELIVFDRVAFLEWIPELAIAIAGSFSGTVAIMSLCTDPSRVSPQHKMQVVARIPEQTPTHPLYGVAVYRHPDSTVDMPTITLYLLYLDGQLMAYELCTP